MIWPLPPSPCPLSYVVMLCILLSLLPKQIISAAYIVSFLSANKQQRNISWLLLSENQTRKKACFSVCLFVDQVWSQDQPRMCFTHCLSVQAPPLTDTICPSWLFAFLQHIGVGGDWETLLIVHLFSQNIFVALNIEKQQSGHVNQHSIVIIMQL